MVSKGIPCVVCHVTKHERPELSFHTFPKNKKRALEWINALRHEPLREKNLDQIIRSNRLCSLHFSGANYVQGKNSSRLRWDACPDTFLGDGNMDVLPPSINDEDQSEFASYSENIDVMPQYDSTTLHFTYEQQFGSLCTSPQYGSEIAPDFKYPSPRKILHNIHGSSNKKQEDTVSQCNITDDRGRVSDFRSASSDSFNQEHEDIIAEERNDDAGTASAFRSVFSDCCNQEHEHTIPELNISDDRSASSSDQPSDYQNTGARKSKRLSGKETKLKNKIPPSRKRRRKVFGTPEMDSVFVIEEINTNIGKESKIACEEEVSSQEGGSDMDPLEESIFIKQESIDHEEGEESLSESKILNSSEGMQMKEEVIIKEEYVEAFDFTDWD